MGSPTSRYTKVARSLQLPRSVLKKTCPSVLTEGILYQSLSELTLCFPHPFALRTSRLQQQERLQEAATGCWWRTQAYWEGYSYTCLKGDEFCPWQYLKGLSRKGVPHALMEIDCTWAALSTLRVRKLRHTDVKHVTKWQWVFTNAHHLWRHQGQWWCTLQDTGANKASLSLQFRSIGLYFITTKMEAYCNLIFVLPPHTF